MRKLSQGCKKLVKKFDASGLVTVDEPGADDRG